MAGRLVDVSMTSLDASTALSGGASGVARSLHTTGAPHLLVTRWRGAMRRDNHGLGISAGLAGRVAGGAGAGLKISPATNPHPQCGLANTRTGLFFLATTEAPKPPIDSTVSTGPLPPPRHPRTHGALLQVAAGPLLLP